MHPEEEEKRQQDPKEVNYHWVAPKRGPKISQKVNYRWAAPKRDPPKKLPLGGGSRSGDKSGDVARGDRHSGLRSWIFENVKR